MINITILTISALDEKSDSKMYPRESYIIVTQIKFKYKKILRFLYKLNEILFCFVGV